MIKLSPFFRQLLNPHLSFTPNFETCVIAGKPNFSPSDWELFAKRRDEGSPMPITKRKARRAFWALKGIPRLQALVRGHPIRRQAVDTLSCMSSIVEFQAPVRGQSVRHSRNLSQGEPMETFLFAIYSYYIGSLSCKISSTLTYSYTPLVRLL